MVLVHFPISSINLSIRQGTLTAIVGHVGSGKSSLLAAILGELHKTSGHIYRQVSTFLLVITRPPEGMA